MRDSHFTKSIIQWYNQHKRSLPWRDTRNPYLIWLSEIILQQTRVSQGLPYYQKFVEHYPTIQDLARAEEAFVLRLWQGLGYYTRARNLHKCAQLIVSDYNGAFPTTMKELLKLPGIGRYTAAAISSNAFDEPVPVIDGNVYRLLSRYFADGTDISTSGAYQHFYHLAHLQIDANDPGTFNQAMMEMGAVQCLPKNPDCYTCVLNENCLAYKKGIQQELPIKTRKVKTKTRHLYYLVIRDGDRVLMRERKEKDIWQGLFEFALVENSSSTDFDQLEHPILHYLEGERINIEIVDKKVVHVLTHQNLNVNFAVIDLDEGQKVSEKLKIDGHQWYTLQGIEELPKPILISNFLDTYLN